MLDNHLQHIIDNLSDYNKSCVNRLNNYVKSSGEDFQEIWNYFVKDVDPYNVLSPLAARVQMLSALNKFLIKNHF